MRKINMIVIHCSATEDGRDYSVREITKWHIKRGFRTIGYHFLIQLNGEISRGRKIEEIGAHAKGYNANSIGICYVGGLKDKKPSDTRTINQIHSIRGLVAALKSIYDIDRIVGHRDLSVDLNADGMVTKDEWMKDCPCFDVKTEL